MTDTSPQQHDAATPKDVEAAKRTWVVHPFLFAMFPVLFVYAQNIEQFSPDAMLLPGLVLLLGTCVLWGLLSLVLRNVRKAAVVVSLFVVLLFSYEAAYRSLLDLGQDFLGFSASPKKTALVVWFVVFVTGGWFAVRSRRPLDRLTKVVNAVAATLVVLSLVGIVSYGFRTTGETPVDEATDTSQAKSTSTGDGVAGPDIYYIIVDAYGRQDVLRWLYGFDNAGFIGYLKDKGFYVAEKSTSNYRSTVPSVSSALNHDYLTSLLPDLDVTSTDQLPLSRLIRHSRVARFLRKRGYTVIAFSSGAAASEMTTADVYLAPGWFSGEFSNALLNMTPTWVLFQKLAVAPQGRKRITYTFDQLERLPERPSPKFIYAHVMAPHRPFVFGPKGEHVNPVHLNDEGGKWNQEADVEDYRTFYSGQVAYVNARLKAMIEAILTKSDRPPVIIIQGDHGPRSLSAVVGHPQRWVERFSILNAYYLPGDAEPALWPEISPVNTFRVVFNRYFGQQYERLSDKCWASEGERLYKLTDVTDEVRCGVPSSP